MSVDLLVFLFVLSLWTAAAVWVWRVHRRAGQHPGRACPKCGYDLRGRPDSRRCSECGHEAGHESELTTKMRFSGRKVTIGFIVLMAAPLLMLPWTRQLFDSWVYYPGLRLVVSMTGPDAVVPAGKMLPHPTVTYSGSLYDRLVWDRQFAQAMQAWGDMVVLCDGSAAEIEELAPAAMEIYDLFQYSSKHVNYDNWFSEPQRDKFYDQRNEIDIRSPVPLGSWIFSELQLKTGNPQMAWFWTPPPREIMETLAESSDPMIRMYVMDRVTVVEFKWAGDILRRFVNDPDDKIAEKAVFMLQFREGRWP